MLTRLGFDCGEQVLAIWCMDCGIRVSVRPPGADGMAGDEPVCQAAAIVEVHLQLVADVVSGQSVTILLATEVYRNEMHMS